MSRDCLIDLKRCICIHGYFQVVDAVLQYLLYQRGIVPGFVGEILAKPVTSQELKFAENYGKIRETLKQIFRSGNRKSLKQTVILIGNSCLLPKEIYVVNGDLCSTEDPDNCHPNCSELSDKYVGMLTQILLFFDFFISNYLPLTVYFILRERRKVSLTLLKLLCCTSELSGAQVYVFVRAKSTLNFPGDLVEEDEGFELPSESKIERKRIEISQICLKHYCGIARAWSLKDDEDDDLTWFRVSTHLRQFSA
uniref:XPGI domain-containing protein n=1 Tax=Syphacia muris TaxID=451379 RepID=A0A0N5APP1_9BILA